MIESISTDVTKSKMFSYASKLDIFKSKERIEFKPGLNVLFGWNGSGKSTILNIIGNTMAAIQSGTSVVTSKHILDTIEYYTTDSIATDKIAVDVVHDGQPIVYCDPNIELQLDDDFFGESIARIFSSSRSSTGEKVIKKCNRVLQILSGKSEVPNEIRYIHPDEEEVTKDRFFAKINNVWQAKFLIVEERLRPKLPTIGQPTICLDEPDANLGFVPQMRMWDIFRDKKVVDKYQLIVATHSLASLGIKGANYIDLDDGEYRNKCITKFTELANRLK